MVALLSVRRTGSPNFLDWLRYLDTAKPLTAGLGTSVVQLLPTDVHANSSAGRFRIVRKSKHGKKNQYNSWFCGNDNNCSCMMRC